MGGDSASVGETVTIDAMPKVFRLGEFVIGTAGDARLSDLMRFCFKPPAVQKGADLDALMATKFVSAMRACFRANDYATEPVDGEAYQGNVLVGVRGGLYMVDGNFAVTRSVSGVDAIGSGALPALGALYATPDEEPLKRLRTALEISARVVDGVRGPFTIECAPAGRANETTLKAWKATRRNRKAA